MRTRSVTGIILLLFGLATKSQAREIEVPLALDNEWLRHMLIRQIYTGPQHTARLWDDGSGCNYLVLSNPRIDSREQQLRILSDGEAKLGTAVGSQCILLLNWVGVIETFQKPTLDPQNTTVHFQTTESNFYNLEGGKSPTEGKLWDQIKNYVHPQLAQIEINLQPLLADLRQAFPEVFFQEKSQIPSAIHSLNLSEVQTTGSGIRVTLKLTLSESETARSPQPPAPVLSPEEWPHWEAVWQPWDAFLTFVLTRAAAASQLEDLRLSLLEILLDARYQIWYALTIPTPPGTIDPVRTLFLQTWKRLAPVLYRLSTELPGDTALRYLSFIAAGDALKIIDQVSPKIGLEISAEGLRRLARIIDPQLYQDPLAYSFKVDPHLRRSFGFSPSLTSSPPRPPPSSGPISRWFWPSAWAADGIDSQLKARLNRWAPSVHDINAYLPLAHQLLDQTSRQIFSAHHITPPLQALYRGLLLATAWQESCWRQFIKQGGTIRPLQSGAGSVGLMQVNQNVWRGFYDVQGLKRDIAYNAKAGGEILMHYLVDYALKQNEHKATGNIHNLARATYAAYNGGPRHLRRYRKSNTPPALRQIDASFWNKYQTIQQGNELAVARCYGVAESALEISPTLRKNR